VSLPPVRAAISITLHLGLPISYVPEIVRAFAWAELSQGVGEGVRGGVNIAARLEGLCELGGVLILGTAYEHVQGKIDAQLVDLGDKDLKSNTALHRSWMLAERAFAQLVSV
jgi:hypothetical protein